MCMTTHTVQNQDGYAERVTVHHSRCSAIQYDIYVPIAIWTSPAVQTFLTRLLSVESGATVFHGLTGVWQGETEGTKIYRLILRADRFQRNNVTDTLRQEIGRLMAELSLTPQQQQAFIYTKTEIEMNLSIIP